jgi:hypothetical protein
VRKLFGDVDGAEKTLTDAKNAAMKSSTMP